MEKSVIDIIHHLTQKGVNIIDARQTFISREVDADRIFPGCILYPGTRLAGARTLVGSSAKIGSEGPATIEDSIIGPGAEVASGFISGATLLPEARAGANAHFRSGTLLEEKASTAHAVGLKQTILMYSVTLGSLINFCDALISGGRSRSEHTEVGSGFIHFNFTPWGKSGDKATPSMIGNVVDGVFLDQDRVFLGGQSGIVGPYSAEFGKTTPAGRILRRSSAGPDGCVSSDGRKKERLDEIREKNLEFIKQLFALKEWYSQIRLKRSDFQGNFELSLVLSGAIETIGICIHERIARYNSFAREWRLPPVDETSMNGNPASHEFSPDWKPDLNYDEWVWGLNEHEKTELRSWLGNFVNRISL